MMHIRKFSTARAALIAIGGAGALFYAGVAGAFPQTQNAWEDRYGASSDSAANAGCQLCHVNSNGGSPWNGYGWDIRDALSDPACDLNGNSVVSNAEAFFCVELDNSDNDGSGYDNVTETGLSTQPGWTNGPFNTYYSRGGTSTGNLPPEGIGQLDPDGTEPPPEPPLPPDDDSELPPGQLKRKTIVVRPGDSIQDAIDRAKPGTRIYILAGTYREVQNPTNGLTITKSGISLIGQTTKDKRVVLENAGSQRNGIVVVPEDRADCMSCHTDLGPPFPVKPGTPMGLKMREPMMNDFEIRGIDIKGFRNNGLFTENLDGFLISDVKSIDNRNYGIFPVLSKNGIITHTEAVGSDLDSGIWIETSENVVLRHSVVSGNVNGIEVSNSDDILVAHNEAYGNTVGAAILLLPDIFDDRPGAKRIDVRNNHIHDNNKDNSARPGSVLSYVPRGTGILYLGVDESTIANNRVENNEFTGIAIADYCLTVSGTPYDCFAGTDPTITPEFLADQSAKDNRVIENVLINNGTVAGPPTPEMPFAPYAADLTLLSLEFSNCYADNLYSTSFWFFGALPTCP
jgi:parallel beta-helix repeat protein